MKKSNSYSPEVRECAVSMVLENLKDYPSEWAAIESIAPKIGCVPRRCCPWDHKPIIAHRFTPAVDTGVPQHFHRYHDRVYFYDVWPNIHYGYVGRACGFSESELLDGAGSLHKAMLASGLNRPG